MKCEIKCTILLLYDKVMKDFDRDYWMSAEESVEYGIVDEILK